MNGYSTVNGSVYAVVVTGEHSRVLGRPPHCGPRRARKKTFRTVATQCDQLQQLQPSTKHCSQTCTPTSTEVVKSTTTTSTSGCATVDDHLSVINLLNIRDGSRPSSAESSSSSTAPARKRESPRPDADGGSLAHGGLCVSKRSLRCATLPLDNVDLWEDNSDSELMALTAVATDSGPLPTTTATQTWVTTANDDDSQRHSATAKRTRERRKWSKRHNQHPVTCRLYQQTGRPATSAVDSRTGSDWRCPSLREVTPATSPAACNSCGIIPGIIESSGRPATANRSAAELSHGSVELHQRRTGAGLDLFIRGMQLRLVDNGERSTTRSDIKPTQANMTRLHDITSLQRHRLRFTSALSCSTLRLH